MPFAALWVHQVRTAKIPPTPEVRLDMAIGLAVLGIPAMLAAWLLWRAWWRQAGPRPSTQDGPRWLLAAATVLMAGVALPAGRVFAPAFVGLVGALGTVWSRGWSSPGSRGAARGWRASCSTGRS
jgi:hypothetical protein